MNGKLSHTQISTYCDCPRKWELVYKQFIKTTSPHLKLGILVHDTLCTGIVPDEWMSPELKDAFEITSWGEYFAMLKQELDEKFPSDRYEVLDRERVVENEIIEGVIDLVMYDKEDDVYMLMDYKVTSTPKTYDVLKLDEQLYIYAALWSKEKNIPLSKIKTGFISLPKYSPAEPPMLRNGKLSKAMVTLKHTTKEKYLNAIKKNYFEVEDYEDALLELDTIKHIHVVCDFVDIDMLEKLNKNLTVIKQLIDQGIVWEHFSAKCVDCEYRKYCKKEK